MINTPSYQLPEEPEPPSSTSPLKGDLLQQALQVIEVDDQGNINPTPGGTENTSELDLVSAGVFSMEFEKEVKEAQQEMGSQ